MTSVSAKTPVAPYMPLITVVIELGLRGPRVVDLSLMLSVTN